MVPVPTMRNRFDKLAKQIGREALRVSGTTVVHDEINAEAQYADLRHEPDPALQVERERLGLLGRLSAAPCIIEVYSEAPDAEEFRACLSKHLASWRGRVRKARSGSRKPGEPRDPEAVVDSLLWIIAARAPTKLLTSLELKAAPGWPAGVYLFGAEVLRVGLIVAGELPRDVTTLLVRLMAGGPLLPQTVVEVAALPRDAYVRAVAEPVLLAFEHVVGHKPNRTPDEQEFIMAMRSSWWEEAYAQGRTEGRTEARADAVLTVLRVRGIAVSDAARERILAQRDLSCLKRWEERAVTAASVDEVLDERS